MDLKQIADQAFTEAYSPLTNWQKFAVEEACDIVETIKRQPGFDCEFSEFGPPVTYCEHESEGNKYNIARIDIDVTYDRDTESVSIEFTESFLEGKRKATCSVGSIDKHIDLSSKDYINLLLREILTSFGKKRAERETRKELKKFLDEQMAIRGG